MGISKRKKRREITTSKRIVGVILFFAIVDIQLSFILAFLDKAQNESVTIALITEIVSVVLGYFVKSFRETREAENMKYRRDRNNMESEEEET